MNVSPKVVEAWRVFANDLDLSPKDAEAAKKAFESLAWRQEQIDGQFVSGFYHAQVLDAAIDETLSISAIAEKFSRETLMSFMVWNVYRLVFKQLPDLEGELKKLIGVLMVAKEQEFDVYRPVNGVSFAANETFTCGPYTFLPRDEANKILTESFKALPNVTVNTASMVEQSYVRFRVSCGDGAKAKELAEPEFRWLEHAIKFFLKDSHCDFGIATFDQTWLENSYVLVADGGVANFSSSMHGSVVPIRIDQKLAAGTDIALVIEKLGGGGDGKNDLRKRLRRAVYLGGLSTCEPDPALAYFLCISAFESIFQRQKNDYVTPSISQQIVEVFCYLLSNENDRRKTFDEMHEFYKKRSAFAHGGDTEVTQSDVSLVRRYLRTAVLRFLTDAELSKMTNVDQIHDRIKDIKFGVRSSEIGMRGV